MTVTDPGTSRLGRARNLIQQGGKPELTGEELESCFLGKESGLESCPLLNSVCPCW